MLRAPLDTSRNFSLISCDNFAIHFFFLFRLKNCAQYDEHDYNLSPNKHAITQEKTKGFTNLHPKRHHHGVAPISSWNLDTSMTSLTYMTMSFYSMSFHRVCL